LKSALVLELTGKERFRFGYEQLSSVRFEEDFCEKVFIFVDLDD
jgi:hypothetical protein